MVEQYTAKEIQNVTDDIQTFDPDPKKTGLISAIELR